ncbi:MAG TPA: isoleucine--tRNA ligase, partial [Bdellovibrionales bacterium]|nr:isoleucine--tRNA ligase [Bdellovibrionales bacterium]
TRTEMNAYRLYNVVPSLLQFIEELTNTYIRFNRSHFWQEGMPEDKRLAYETLYYVLITLSKVMAPFAPFMSEVMYQNLTRSQPPGAGHKESVHLELFPEVQNELRKPALEESVHRMEVLVTLGRNLREKIGVKAKIPLKSLRLIHRDQVALDGLNPLKPYFQDELNIEAILLDANEDKFVQVSCKANFPVLGKKLGPKMKTVAAEIQKLPIADILKLEQGQTLTLAGESISLSDVEIRRAARGDNPNLLTHQLISIEIDPTITPAQVQVGLAREIIRKVQAARKAADFKLDNRIHLELKLSGELKAAAEAHQAMIKENTLTLELVFTDNPQGQHVETAETDEGPVTIGLRVLK